MDVAYARSWSLGLDLRLLLAHAVRSSPTKGHRMSVAVAGAEAGPRRRRRARVLGPEPRAEPARNRGRRASSRVCDLRRRSARRDRPALPGAFGTTTRFEDVLADRRRGGSDRDAGLDATFRSRSPRSRPASTCSSRSRSRRRRAEAVELMRARGRARPRADAGPHVSLQPTGDRDPRADRVGRARRDLLHLDEPRQPRAAPAGRERRLGSRPARLLDPPVLARRDADRTSARSAAAACIPGIPDVAFINLEYASGTVAHVELSWLAPSKLRRTTIVGSQKMVVYDDTGTEPVRIFDSGVSLPDPETFGEYRLTYRTGDILSPRVDAAEPLALELTDFATSIRHGETPRSSAAARARGRADDRSCRRVAGGERSSRRVDAH